MLGATTTAFISRPPSVVTHLETSRFAEARQPTTRRIGTTTSVVGRVASAGNGREDGAWILNRSVCGCPIGPTRQYRTLGAPKCGGNIRWGRRIKVRSAEEAWDKWVDDWDDRVISTRCYKSREVFLRSGLQDTEAVLSRFGLPLGGYCHEIGCGTGRMTAHLCDRFDVVTANDISSSAIHRGASDLERAEVSHGGPEALAPLPADRYDCVVAVAVLQHISSCDDVLEYVRQTQRILGPRGRGALQVARATTTRRVHDSIVDAGRRVISGVSTPSRPAPRGEHWRGCRPADELLIDAGGGAAFVEVVQGDRLTDWIVLRGQPPS